ncbi:uncharacterized protein PV09_07848 [Verruconis gallopava]|uniref:AGC-kinase C-terminal domain-containing protein n=1 Tax=Verruconis gallopava TaxID=253628 RepID=A0A0D1XEN9_9PEZI|nr:uncharacterized protein PV09_07848 [Verruconis gallopava]KIW00661.1 hypothetical protein PV09_07848 [Verruconis gallopava]
MFAKLRPAHRRGGSTPTSPSPNQIPSGFLPLPPGSSHGPASPNSIEDFLHGFKSPDSLASTGAPPPQPVSSDSPISPMPPSLPPIPRVASVYEKQDGEETSQGLGLGLQQTELQRVQTTESLDSQSSGSPILGDQMFSPARFGGQEQQEWRSGTASESGPQYRPQQQPQATAPPPPPPPPPPRKDVTSKAEFRSILQGKHLPPLPNSANAPRKPHEVISPPPVPLSEDAHQVYARTPATAPGNQSRQSLNPNTTKVSDKMGKPKTRLLNPMSLLLRRRNGQVLDHLSEESLVSHRSANVISPSLLPDDYDPSIRGKVVHDFSAPRPRRNFTNQNVPEAAERERRESASREGRDPQSRKLSDDLRQQHTPVFKEHFEDDVDQQKKESAIRAEHLANKDFVKRNSFQPLDETENTAALPPFARVGQKTVYRPEEAALPSPPPPPVPAKDGDVQLPTRQTLPLSPLMEDPVAQHDSDATPKRTSNVSTVRQSTLKSQRSPPSARSSRISRASSGTGGDFTPNGLPAHMLSRASRFSFQYGNTDSAAQERMLEEKHREKVAKAQAERKHESYDGEDDDYDYDDMDFDGMEDDVPMNGEDWDYGGGGLGIGNMTLEDMNANQGLSNMSLDDFNSGYDDEDSAGDGGGLGHMTLDDMPSTTGGGLAHMTLDSMQAAAPKQPAYNPLRDNPVGAAQSGANYDSGTNGADKESVDTANNPSAAETLNKSAEPNTTQPASELQKVSNVDSFIEQDDFYFDNGEFADELLNEVNEDAQAFDESVFDDPNHPLYDRKQPTQAPPIPRMSSKRVHNTMRGRKPRSRPPSEPLPQHPDPDAPLDVVTAYHSALAMAANKAAASGRFDRANSVDSSDGSSPVTYHGGPVQLGADKQSPNNSTHPDLTPDVARLSQESSTLSPPTARASGGDEFNSLSKAVGFMLPGAGTYDDPFSSDFDYSDYDSTFEDDPMIAAANAEALENDVEGLYGSEFGFYARPGASDNGDGSADCIYGGYFGPKNWGEVKRQRSTREPNLTPITERSEYSTRNSFVGIGFAEHERGAPSPGLAALARMSPGWEGDINMETLMKLRRGAWGGSQASNVDKSSPRTGNSPMSSSPVAVKSGEGVRPQQTPQWSSPISRQMMMHEEEDPDADDEYDENMLEEANCDEDEYEGDEEQSWQQNAGGENTSPEDETPPSGSPTIQAGMLSTQPAQRPSSLSPVRLDQCFNVFGANDDASQRQTGQLSLQNGGATISIPVATATSSNSQRSSGSLALTNSPISPTVAENKRGHTRSGSDSVAYVRERDEENGEFRWVLERRRTGEDGGEVLVERTTVEGGRI